MRFHGFKLNADETLHGGSVSVVSPPINPIPQRRNLLAGRIANRFATRVRGTKSIASGPFAAMMNRLSSLIRSGVFDSEKLVNMSKHDYTLEPNVVFTPDNKWIIFRSNMFGKSHVFAVEVAKANATK